MRFTREPALLLGFLASLIQVVSAFVLPLSVGQQGALNAVAVAVLGLVTALAVKGDKLAPAILGFIQAAVALGVAFGWELSAQDSSVLMAMISAGVAMFVRQVVVAPVAPTEARAVPTSPDATDPAV